MNPMTDDWKFMNETTALILLGICFVVSLILLVYAIKRKKSI